MKVDVNHLTECHWSGLRLRNTLKFIQKTNIQKDKWKKIANAFSGAEKAWEAIIQKFNSKEYVMIQRKYGEH